MDNLISITQLGAVSCDFDSIKNHLNDQLQLYSNLVFTEETKKEAKTAVADLRKEKKLFTDRLKEAKAEYLKPWEEFSTKAMEIAEMYDVPICKINDQIDEFEAKRIEAKKLEISRIYDEMIPEEEWRNIIPMARIYNLKWENATFTAKQIKDEMMTHKINAKEAVKALEAMGSEKYEEALEMYKRTFDLPACMTFIANYEKQKREIMAQEEERLKREAEERIRAEERAKIEEEQKHQAELENAKAQMLDRIIPVYDGVDPIEYTYIIRLTPSEKEALEMYMESIGIDFNEIPM